MQYVIAIRPVVYMRGGRMSGVVSEPVG